MMAEGKQYGGLDYAKLVAAFLVVAVHTAPLASLCGEADFLLTRVLARVAVPLFLMVTGYFIPAECLNWGAASPMPRQFFQKTALLYAIATAIYLPIGLYAGHFQDIDLPSILRMVVFDGTFYHLWYLPASILGVALICCMGRRLPRSAVLGISLVLYLIGLGGDSYFGLVSQNAYLSSGYDLGFALFSYTRNGIFYAPVFLVMGAWMRQSYRRFSGLVGLVGFIISMAVMMVEGFTLRFFEVQRHDSMYLALLPAMLFLFGWLLSLKAKPVRRLGGISTWIYIIHPCCIVAVRGVAKLTGLTALFVGNSLLHYSLVCVLSLAFAVLVTKLSARRKDAAFPQGRAWIELDRAALRHNVAALSALLPKGCEMMAAVKANAYGHGAVLMSRELNRLGVKAFCVAAVAEGVALRRKGIGGDIIVLGYTHPEQFVLIRRYRLQQTVVDYAYAQLLNAYGKTIKVQIGIDTGMHRLGERAENVDHLHAMFRLPNIKVEGAFTHFCVADTMCSADKAFTLAQGQAFQEVVQELRNRGCVIPKLHLQSSYGLLNYPELSGDYARLGIALYGTLSTGADREACSVPLLPVLSLKARVATVKDLYRGEHAGYGLQFRAEEDRLIAVVSIGYADGLPRALSCGKGSMLIRGCVAPIIGRICMDQTLVDVTDIPDAAPGDVAVIIGKSEAREIGVCDVADQANTITNEVLSQLGPRLERCML